MGLQQQAIKRGAVATLTLQPFPPSLAARDPKLAAELEQWRRQAETTLHSTISALKLDQDPKLRRISGEFTATQYLASGYMDITHNLGTYGVTAVVWKTKDATGAVDSLQQDQGITVQRPVALGNNKVRIRLVTAPTGSMEFGFSIFG